MTGSLFSLNERAYFERTVDTLESKLSWYKEQKVIFLEVFNALVARKENPQYELYYDELFAFAWTFYGYLTGESFYLSRVI